ncbi:MAG: L,D-transpeptidase family protein [Solirubrobacterales bacterium]
MGGDETSSIRERPDPQRGWDFSGVAGNGRGRVETGRKRQRPTWPPSRSVLIAGGLAIAVLLAAYVYDSSRKELVRAGVHVAGVDIGGLRAEAARAKLRRRLSGRLEQPVRVRAAGSRFKLTPARAALTADVDGMVDDAISAGRSSIFPARVFEGLTGSESDADLPAKANYSRVAVRRFARDVKRDVDRSSRDAEVNFTGGATATLPVVPSQTGLKLNAARLRRAIETGIAATALSERTVRAPVRVSQPDVTSEDLAPKYPIVTTIDRANFKLRLFKDLRLAATYPIAVGQAGLETPAGLYHVTDKAVDPAWNVPDKPWAGDLAGTTVPGGAPDNPLKSRWLGFFDGAGIHGTAEEDSLGTAASHGCIRMKVSDVEQLYPQVPVGAPVYVQ